MKEYVMAGALLILWIVFMVLFIIKWRRQKKLEDQIGQLYRDLRKSENEKEDLKEQVDEKACTISRQAAIIADLKTEHSAEILKLKREKLVVAEQVRGECEAEKRKIADEFEAELQDEKTRYAMLEKEYQDFEKSCKIGEYMISQAEAERIDLERQVKILTAENNRLKAKLKEEL